MVFGPIVFNIKVINKDRNNKKKKKNEKVRNGVYSI